MNLKNYELSGDLADLISVALNKGIKQYASELLRMKKLLKVYGGFAWTKGNFVDSAVAEAFENSDDKSIQFKIAKSGYAWSYIQFDFDNGEPALLVIKPGSYRPKQFSDNNDTKLLQQDAIGQLMHINDKNFDDEDDKSLKISQGEQMVLDLEAGSQSEIKSTIQNLSKNGDVGRFYILTYELSPTGEVIDLSLNMPYSKAMQMIKIQNLKDFIHDSLLDKEGQDVLAELKTSMPSETTYQIDVSVPDEQQKSV